MHVWIEPQMLRHVLPRQQIAWRRHELIDLLIDCVGYRERLVRFGFESFSLHHFYFLERFFLALSVKIFSLLSLSVSRRSIFRWALFPRLLFVFFFSFLTFSLDEGELINFLTNAYEASNIDSYHSHEINFSTLPISPGYNLCLSFD